MTKGSLKRWIACISIVVLLVSTLGSDMSAIRVVHASEINDPTVQVSEEPLSSAEPAVPEESAPAEEAAPSEEPAVPKESVQQEPENQEPISNAIGEALQIGLFHECSQNLLPILICIFQIASKHLTLLLH